jgi:hypothetical protein
MLEKTLFLAILGLMIGVPGKRVEGPPVPLIVRTIGPETERDAKLEDAISVAERDKPNKELHYYYNRVDLKGDGKLAVLVFVFGPGQCGSGGCEAYVFEPAVDSYRLVTDIALAGSPIIVSERKTNGWKDLIMFVAGGGILPGHYTVLHFDGMTYPSNPTGEPSEPLKDRPRGTAYLAADARYNKGLVLRLPGVSSDGRVLGGKRGPRTEGVAQSGPPQDSGAVWIGFEGTVVRIAPGPGHVSGGIAAFRLVKYRVDRVWKGVYDKPEIVVDHLMLTGRELDDIKPGDRACLALEVSDSIECRYNRKGLREPSDLVKVFYIGGRPVPVRDTPCDPPR